MTTRSWPLRAGAACLALGAPLGLRAGESAIAHPALWPKAASPAAFSDVATEARITRLMARMSLAEKVGQTIQGDISSVTPDDLRRYPLGAILAGGSSAPRGDNRAPPSAWLELIRRFQAVAAEPRQGHVTIPLLVGVDAVHGDNKVPGSTLFPHNIGLGAARDPDLIRQIGAATAEEVSTTGVNWTFAPTVAVPRDYRWGRSFEGYAEDPEVVKAYAGPLTLGLQGPLRPGQPLATGHVMGSAKHFLGDGGTRNGVDQGDAEISETDLIRLHAQGYPPAIDAGILSVMASFSAWNGAKDTGNASLLEGVLKGRMGFKGFVVGDWNAHAQIPGCAPADCPAAMNAGLDLYMAPDGWKGLFDNTLAEVKSGVIPISRLDDAVRRILRAKLKGGLFDPPSPLQGRFDLLGSPTHRALARRAVRESLVLLKNDGVLPIKASARILVAGDGADDIGKQSGGWTLNWQGVGNRNTDFPHGQSIWSGIADAVRAAGGQAELSPDGSFKRRPDVAIVVYGENPYAEFQGDLASLEFEPGGKPDLALLKRLKAEGIPVVSVFLSGRPLWTNPEINASDAFVAAWLPGTEGGGVADVLIGKPKGAARSDFLGRLSYSWPARADRTPGHRDEPGYAPQFAYGYGLSYAHPGVVGQLSENPGARVEGPNLERYFVAGRVPSPWSLQASGDARISTVDAGAQENGRRIDFNGSGAAAFEGPPADLVRQTGGDMAVMLRYRVLAAPTAPVSLSVACGDSCGAKVDVTSLLSGTDAGWRTWTIKLSCFRDRGADMSRVTSPFTLSTTGRLSLAFNEVRLVPNPGDAACPDH
ncbi:MAG: exo 1,3/1,4-beta-D-glucan glucohydrolase [Caulobacteraceae bacterium]